MTKLQRKIAKKNRQAERRNARIEKRFILSAINLTEDDEWIWW